MSRKRCLHPYYCFIHCDGPFCLQFGLIVGESYGGVYVPLLAKKILERNRQDIEKAINLKVTNACMHRFLKYCFCFFSQPSILKG